MEEGSESESSNQNVPDVRLKHNAVESAKYAASLARRAQEKLQQCIKQPRKSKIKPGMCGIKEIKEEQSKYNLIIPKAPGSGDLYGCVSMRGRTSVAVECHWCTTRSQ